MADPQGAQISVGPVGVEDLVMDNAARAAALQAFMTGGTTFGAPTRAEQIGLTSRSPEQELLQPPQPTLDEQLEAGQKALEGLQEQQQSVNGDIETELADWKKKYGDRENEFGDLRRKSQELEETLQLLLTQRQTAPQPQQHQTESQFPVNPWQNRPQAPPNFFGTKTKEDLLTVGDTEEVVQNLYGALGMTWQQLQIMQQQNAALQAANVAGAKQAAGITQLDELRLTAKYPYVSTMPDDQNKIGLMKTLLEAERAKAAPAAVAPTSATEATNKVVRRITHTENSKGSTGPSEQTANVLFAQEMEKVKALPFHMRSAAMDKLAAQFNVPTVRALGTGGFRR